MAYDEMTAKLIRENESLTRENAALREALEAAINQEKAIADQLDTWAHESRAGGWSTHQVDPMLKLADSLRRKVAQLEITLAANQEKGEGNNSGPN